MLPTVNASVSNNSLLITIDSSSPLATVGTSALAQSSSGSFLVARTGQDSFAAVGATCTHQICTINQIENQAYVCPCHGAQFSTTGRVLAGPAVAPLPQYATQFNNNVLTITL